MSKLIKQITDGKSSAEIHRLMAEGKLGQPGSPNRDVANNILNAREKEENEARAFSRDEREEETLSIAKEANRIASKALASNVRSERAAWVAAIAALIAAIVAIVDLPPFSTAVEADANATEASAEASHNK